MAGWHRAKHMVNKGSQLNVYGYRTCKSCANSQLKIGVEVSSQLGDLGDFHSDYSFTFLILFDVMFFFKGRAFCTETSLAVHFI